MASYEANETAWQAILFGTLATILGAASVSFAYLQYRRVVRAHHVELHGTHTIDLESLGMLMTR